MLLHDIFSPFKRASLPSREITVSTYRDLSRPCLNPSSSLEINLLRFTHTEINLFLKTLYTLFYKYHLYKQLRLKFCSLLIAIFYTIVLIFWWKLFHRKLALTPNSILNIYLKGRIVQKFGKSWCNVKHHPASLQSWWCWQKSARARVYWQYLQYCQHYSWKLNPHLE